MIRLGPGNKGLLRRGAHRVGGGKIRLSAMIRLGPGNKGLLRRGSPGWRARTYFFILRRGARRVGGGKNRLGDDPSRVESSPWPPNFRAATPLPIELWILATPGFIPHWAGGGKIRLENFFFPGEALTGLEVLEVEGSVSKISCSQERRSPGWRRGDPSRKFLVPRRGAHRAGGGKIRLEHFLSQKRRSPDWRWKDPSRKFLVPKERRSPGWRWKDPSRGISYSQERLAGLEVERSVGLEVERSVSKISCSRSGARRAGGGKIRLENFLFQGEALTTLEVERSVSKISCSQAGWRWKDPSRKFLVPRSGGKIRLENFLFHGEALTGWRWKDPSRKFLVPRSGAPHRAGGGKIRLENFFFSGEALAGLEVERSVSKISCSQEWRSPGWRWKDPSRKFLVPRRGARRAGGGKIRLENFLFPGEALTGLEVERSVSKISFFQERRSPGWRWKDPSRKFLVPRRGAHWVGGGKIRLGEFPIRRK